jgi:hypothetical protein
MEICLALLESGRDQRDVKLEHQVGAAYRERITVLTTVAQSDPVTQRHLTAFVDQRANKVKPPPSA